MVVPIIPVSNLPASASFYADILQPLGLKFVSAPQSSSSSSKSNSSKALVESDKNSTPRSVVFGYSSTPVLEIHEQPAGKSVHPGHLIIASASESAIAQFCTRYSQATGNSSAMSSAVTRARAPVPDLDGNKLEVVHKPDANQKHNTRILNWNKEVAKSSVGAPSTIATSVPKSSVHCSNSSAKRSSSAKPKSSSKDYAPGDGSHFDSAGAAVLGFLGVAAGAALAFHTIKNSNTKKTTENEEAAPPTLSRSNTTPAKPKAAKYEKSKYGPSASRTKDDIDTASFKHVKAPSTVASHIRTRSEVSTTRKPLLLTEANQAKIPGASFKKSSASSDFMTVADASQKYGKPSMAAASIPMTKFSGGYSEAELDALAAKLRADRHGSSSGHKKPSSNKSQQWKEFNHANQTSRAAAQSSMVDDFQTVADASQKYGAPSGSSRSASKPKSAPLSEAELAAKAAEYMRNKSSKGAAPTASSHRTSEKSSANTSKLSSVALAALQSLGNTKSGGGGYVDDFQTLIEGSDDGYNKEAEMLKLAAKHGVQGGYDVGDFKSSAGAVHKHSSSKSKYVGTAGVTFLAAGAGRGSKGGYVDDFQTLIEGGDDDYDKEAEMLKLAAKHGVQGGYDVGDFKSHAGTRQKYSGVGASTKYHPSSGGMGHVSGAVDDFCTVVESNNSEDERESAAAALRAKYNIPRGGDSDFRTLVDAKHKNGKSSSSCSKSTSKKPSTSSSKPITMPCEVPDDFETVIEQSCELMKFHGKIPSDFQSTVGEDRPKGFHLGNTARPDLVDDGASEVGRRGKPSKSSPKSSHRSNKSKSPSNHSRHRHHSRAPSAASSSASQSSKLTARTPPSEFISKWDTETVVPGDSISQVGR